MITIEKFPELREKIKNAQDKESRINGSLDQIEEQLKKEPDIKNIDEAESTVNKLDTEINALLKDQEDKFQKLETIIDWNKL